MGTARVCRIRNKESVKRVYRVQKRSLSISCLQNFGHEKGWFLCLEHHLDHGTILEIDRLIHYLVVVSLLMTDILLCLDFVSSTPWVWFQVFSNDLWAVKVSVPTENIDELYLFSRIGVFSIYCILFLFFRPLLVHCLSPHLLSIEIFHRIDFSWPSP